MQRFPRPPVSRIDASCGSTAHCPAGPRAHHRLVGLLCLLGASLAPAVNVNAAETPESSCEPVAAPSAGSSSATDVIRPIYYPHSPRLYRDTQRGSEVDRLLDEFLHLHTALRYEEALAVIEKLIELVPDSAAMHYNHACVLGRLLRTDEAIDALERAVELGWRNLSHLQVDPDLHALRWSSRYENIAERLASKIRRERPSPGPLRDDAWETIVRDIEAVAPSLLASNGVASVTMSLVRDGRHVWTGALAPPAAASANDETHKPQPPDPQRTYRVEGPAHLLGMLGVLEKWEGHGEPGVLRLVELCRHATKTEMATTRSAQPVDRQTRGGTDRTAGASAREQRATANRNRHIVGDRVLRISHVPNDVHDLIRLAVEHLSGTSFIRYCRERAFPMIGMENSELIIVDGRDGRAVRRASRDAQREGNLGQNRAGRPGPPRLALETTADDLAALLAHILAMERSVGKQTMDWRQISDHLLRSCVTRGLSIGSTIAIHRTPFGLRTEVSCVGSGAGSVMRWYPQSNSGVVLLFDEGEDGSGRRAAERLAHLALGGEP